MHSYSRKSFIYTLTFIFAVLLGFAPSGKVYAGQDMEDVCDGEFGGADDCSMMPESGGGFTNGSLRGTYSIRGVSEGGAPAQSAGIGMLHANGKGRFKVKVTLNTPNPDYPNERVVRTIETEGHYQVNPDGMGHFIGLGPSGDMNDAFVITDAYNKKRKKLATELFVVSGNLSRNAGVLVTFTLKRLP